jgi:predicted Zn-dependent protease
MLNFLRFPFASHTETDEEFLLRMGRYQKDLDTLVQKQPGEVTGDPLESVYYGLKLSQALKSGDPAEARHLLSEMLRVAPRDSLTRLTASIAYVKLGEEAEAIAQLGIALGLDPANYAVHKMLARLLAKRGEQQAAEAVLEQGWVHYRKHMPKGDQEAVRSEYFSVIENKQAA